MPETKIIATIGPSSEKESILRKMFIAGVDIIRFNFSHGNYETFSKNIKAIKELNKKMRRAIKILADLKGNRIRVRNIKENIPLKKGEIIFLTKKNIPSDSKTISFDYSGDLKPIKAGHRIYIDDGTIELEVLSVKKDTIKAKVLIDGILKDKKGVNIPESKLDFPILNSEDKNDLIFALDNSFDYIAQSFVRTAKDITIIKKIVKEKNSKALVIAKIENREALENIDEIIEVSDGIMIARGDLGISVPIYEIPVIQKELLRKAIEKKKMAIVATHMLESMIENNVPTRAEVTDVANAIFDGAKFLMLSAETAAGKHPVESVNMMNKIIIHTEKFYDKYGRV